MFLIILSKLKSRDGILGSPQPRESFTRNLHRFPQPSLDEIRSLSISEQENGADNLKKHSNVLVLEVGSPSKYTVDTVRVLPFFQNKFIEAQIYLFRLKMMYTKELEKFFHVYICIKGGN